MIADLEGLEGPYFLIAERTYPEDWMSRRYYGVDAPVVFTTRLAANVEINICKMTATCVIVEIDKVDISKFLKVLEYNRCKHVAFNPSLGPSGLPERFVKVADLVKYLDECTS